MICMIITDMVATLRQLAVKKWVDNSHHYEPFLSDVNTEEESIKFLDSSHYQSDLGDSSTTLLMCLAKCVGDTNHCFFISPYILYHS